MEAQAALVRADGHAVLDAKPAVDLDRAMVVHPGNPEDQDALWLHQPFQQAQGGVPGVLLDVGPQAFHDFRDGLEVFDLAGIALRDMVKKTVDVRVFHSESC